MIFVSDDSETPSAALACYRTPGHSSLGVLDIFLMTVNGLLSYFRPSSKLIVAGNFNIKFNIEETEIKRFCDLLVSCGLMQRVFQSTRLQTCVIAV